MCGIVGYIGDRAVNEVLLTGLRKLEYRGYDSAGIAVIDAHQKLQRTRAKGKLVNLAEKLAELNGTAPAHIGIGHTRWATHGKPEEYNAHPHTDTLEQLAVVQNGIVENYHELRQELKSLGHKFVTDTDTEVIPHLIAEYLQELTAGKTERSLFWEAVRHAVNRLKGAFAIAIIHQDYPHELIVVRQQAPLIVGVGKGEFFCASDTPALISYTNQIIALENGDMARLTRDGVEVYNFHGDRQKRPMQILSWNPMMVEKQGFRHYMLKEIYEQPGVIRTGIATFINDSNQISLPLPESLLKTVRNMQILACGTSWHASLVGKYLLEQLAGVPTQVHYASEYRYAPPPKQEHTLVIGVTQSGETADTLAALELARAQGQTCIGITNRPESSIGRLADYILDTKAGIEIGVAATKTFLAQLLMFYLLALSLASQRQTLAVSGISEIIDQLRQLPAYIERILETQERYVEHLTHQFAHTKDFIYLGRGINFPIALEGALKLKEISYIHAEGYPAGEMKHGPIALVDEETPSIFLTPRGSVFDKVMSNLEEVKARRGPVIAIASEGDAKAATVTNRAVRRSWGIPSSSWSNFRQLSS